jgi:hypothetical protein
VRNTLDKWTQWFTNEKPYGGLVATMRKYSYESILRAVGRVLDDAEARSFAIRDDEDGLLVETYDAVGKRALTLNFEVADLVKLIDEHAPAADTDDTSRYDLAYVKDKSSLRELLNRRELIGAGRP